MGSLPKDLVDLVLSAEDLNGLNKALFDLFDSYDLKDWERLANNIAPELYVDYRALKMPCWPNMPASDYLAMCSDTRFLGDPTVRCQHLVGASYFLRTSETEAEGRHQIRATVQVYTDETATTPTIKGRAHASNVHWYRKIDGVWKFAGLRPKMVLTEGDYDKVWKVSQKQA